MNHKIKSTLTGTLVALSFVVGGNIVGDAPISTQLATAKESSASAAEAGVTDAASTERRTQRVRRHISMPYFSFGNVFPK
jgi:hypothetical protein